jgi:hypothetical protein
LVGELVADLIAEVAHLVAELVADLIAEVAHLVAELVADFQAVAGFGYTPFRKWVVLWRLYMRTAHVKDTPIIT